MKCAALTEQLRKEAAASRRALIESKRIITLNELQAQMGVSHRSISTAVKSGRLFVIEGPSGEYFYPAFFAEDKYNRRTLEKICNALGPIPGSSKWQFFTTPKNSLDGKTPLEALAEGRLANVLVTAAGFVEE